MEIYKLNNAAKLVKIVLGFTILTIVYLAFCPMIHGVSYDVQYYLSI